MIIIFGITFNVIGKLFRLSSKTKESFIELADAIDEMANQQEGSFIAETLWMDDNTAVFGFSKNSDHIESWRDKGAGPTSDLYFPRPEACLKGKSCLCLCRKNLKWNGKEPPYEVSCDSASMMCLQLEGEMPAEMAHRYPSYEDLTEKRWDGGFIISRGEALSYSSYTITTRLNRMRVVYLEKYEGMVYVCEESPCVPEETKKQKTDQEKAEKALEDLEEVYDLCKSKTGNDCVCNKFDYEEIPGEYSFEFTPLSNGFFIEAFDASRNKISRPIRNTKLCEFKISKNGDEYLKEYLEKEYKEGQNKAEIFISNSPEEKYRFGDVLVFIKHDNNVCFATHGSGLWELDGFDNIVNYNTEVIEVC